MSKTGVGQNTFETRKNRILRLTGLNFFRPTEYFVTVIFASLAYPPIPTYYIALVYTPSAI